MPGRHSESYAFRGWVNQGRREEQKVLGGKIQGFGIKMGVRDRK